MGWAARLTCGETMGRRLVYYKHALTLLNSSVSYTREAGMCYASAHGRWLSLGGICSRKMALFGRHLLRADALKLEADALGRGDRAGPALLQAAIVRALHGAHCSYSRPLVMRAAPLI